MRTKFCLILLLLTGAAGSFGQNPTVGLYFNDSLAHNGYTLFSPLAYNLTYLIDNCGYEVHHWESEYDAGEMAYLLEDGSLIRAGVVYTGIFHGGGVGGILEHFTWDGELIWQFEYHSELYHQHHDIEALPNGNFLMIAWYKYTPEQAIAMGKDPAVLKEELWIDRILEVKPVGPDDGEIVWEWNVWDHWIQDFDESKENYGVVSEHPGKIDINYTDDPGQGGKTDWTHINAVDYNAELDQIMLTVRQYSEIWVIDHSTTTEEASGSTGGLYGKGGDLLYRWGNPEAYDRGTADDQVLRYMHDAHWIPADYVDGNKVLVFNNDAYEQESNVLVFDPEQDEPGIYTDPGNEAFGPDSTDWVYEDPFLYSRVVSGAQRLPNGNTLICEGQGGNFYELTYEDKQQVWHYRCPVGITGPITQGNPPFGISVFRALRYDPDFAAFEGKNLDPGNPIELEPWPYECIIYEDTTSSFVPELSAIGKVSVINPFHDKLEVFHDLATGIELLVVDLLGRQMIRRKLDADHCVINTSEWPAGIYVLGVQETISRKKAMIKILKQ